MDLISLFLFTHENNEIKSLTKIYDFTVSVRTSDTRIQKKFQHSNNSD